MNLEDTSIQLSELSPSADSSDVNTERLRHRPTTRTEDQADVLRHHPLCFSSSSSSDPYSHRSAPSSKPKAKLDVPASRENETESETFVNASAPERGLYDQILSQTDAMTSSFRADVISATRDVTTGNSSSSRTQGDLIDFD